MTRIDAVIIGGGQAGLAMSRCLARRGIEHVVLERGRVGQRWRNEHWESLRLLTPNWMTRLPGWSYRGPDPDGYMAVSEVVDLLDDYAAAAPVQEGVEVLSVTRSGAGYHVATASGGWATRSVIVATGYCQEPRVPVMSKRLASDMVQLTPSSYRNPDLLPDGGVLVVGASASGVQLAQEINRSGRPVTLSVGHHTRVPRVYRGRDILWWMDWAGMLSEAVDGQKPPPPSFQLVGRPDRRTIDLSRLHAEGVRVVGRAVDVERTVVSFRDDLAETTAGAQRRLERVLDRIDLLAGPDAAPDAAARCPIVLPQAPTRLDLRAAGIATVLWAVGYQRSYSWLHLPILNSDGEVVHRGGVTPAPGLYILGLPQLRRRNSSFLDGVGADADALAAHLHSHLAAVAA